PVPLYQPLAGALALALLVLLLLRPSTAPPANPGARVTVLQRYATVVVHDTISSPRVQQATMVAEAPQQRRAERATPSRIRRQPPARRENSMPVRSDDGGRSVASMIETPP